MYVHFKKEKVCSYVISLSQLVSVNGKSSLKDIWYTKADSTYFTH